MIRAIVFDVGGVLHSDVNEFIIADITATLHIPMEKFNRIHNRLSAQLGKGQITERQYWVKFFELAHIKKTLPGRSLFARKFTKYCRINQNILEFVKNLKKRGYITAALTNTSEVHARMVKKLGIYKMFHPLVLSYEVGLMKPNPRIYRMLLRELGTKPHETIFIDDNEKYVRAATRLGIRAIHYKNNRLVKAQVESILKEG